MSMRRRGPSGDEPARTTTTWAGGEYGGAGSDWAGGGDGSVSDAHGKEDTGGSIGGGGALEMRQQGGSDGESRGSAAPPADPACLRRFESLGWRHAPAVDECQHRGEYLDPFTGAGGDPLPVSGECVFHYTQHQGWPQPRAVEKCIELANTPPYTPPIMMSPPPPPPPPDKPQAPTQPNLSYRLCKQHHLHAGLAEEDIPVVCLPWMSVLDPPQECLCVGDDLYYARSFRRKLSAGEGYIRMLPSGQIEAKMERLPALGYPHVEARGWPEDVAEKLYEGVPVRRWYRNFSSLPTEEQKKKCGRASLNELRNYGLIRDEHAVRATRRLLGNRDIC
eukprot:jgi/Tetstr1/448591/TSEL_035840.t1